MRSTIFHDQTRLQISLKNVYKLTSKKETHFQSTLVLPLEHFCYSEGVGVQFNWVNISVFNWLPTCDTATCIFVGYKWSSTWEEVKYQSTHSTSLTTCHAPFCIDILITSALLRVHSLCWISLNAYYAAAPIWWNQDILYSHTSCSIIHPLQAFTNFSNTYSVLKISLLSSSSIFLVPFSDLHVALQPAFLLNLPAPRHLQSSALDMKTICYCVTVVFSDLPPRILSIHWCTILCTLHVITLQNIWAVVPEKPKAAPYFRTIMLMSE